MKAEEGKEKLDAVKMMRQIRDKLSQKYLNNPTAEEKDLAQIRRKYGIETREEV